MTDPPLPPVPAAVFASGGGTNLQTLLDVQRRGAAWKTVLLVSDREDAGAVERARRAGVETRVIDVPRTAGEEVEAATLQALADAGVGAVFLAGYLKLLPAGVVRAFARRILNIHPALLPSFGGKGMYGRRVHQAVLASGARVSGATVHYVDERYDEGTILAQWPVPVLSGDTAETLAARVLEVEHLLYPLAAQHVCEAIQEGSEAGPFPPPASRVGARAHSFSLIGEDTVSTIQSHFEARFPDT